MVLSKGILRSGFANRQAPQDSPSGRVIEGEYVKKDPLNQASNVIFPRPYLSHWRNGQVGVIPVAFISNANLLILIR